MKCLENDHALSRTRLFESEAEYSDYDRNTVTYALNNEKKVKKQILRNCNQLRSDEVDIVYSDLVECLRTEGNDYDESNPSNTVPTLEGFVGTRIGYCVKRYNHDKAERNKKIYNGSENDGLEVGPYDSIKDETVQSEYDTVESTLESSLEQVEYLKHMYSEDLDLYQILYISFISMVYPNGEEKKKLLLSAFGIDDRKMTLLGKELSKNPDVSDLMSLSAFHIEREGFNFVIDKLEKFVYSKDFIKRAILSV